MKQNHIFSFPGGDLLAQMAAWWFVSYSYYLYVDRSHFAWQKVKTAELRRSVYTKSRKYHVYWLCEVLDMERLDVHGNSGKVNSAEVKRMAKEVISRLSNDNGITEIKGLIEELEKQRQELLWNI